MDGIELDLGFEPIDLDETPTEEVETPELEEVAASEAEETPEVEETPTEEPADGRKVPDEVRKALKAFRDASPENAKAASALRDSYGRELAYKAIYPTVKDAQTAQSTMQTIESYGGLTAIQSTIAEIEEVDQLLQSGDPKAIDKIVEVSGEGFTKIAPAMLDRLQASNPEAYAAAIRPHLVDAIGKSGLSEAFGAVIQAYQFSQTPGATPEFKAKWEKDAVEGLSKIQNYLQGLGKKTETSPQPVQENKAFMEREQALAAKEAQQFNTEISTKANALINPILSKAMTPYLRGVKIDQAARSEYTDAIYTEVSKLVKADAVYQRNKDAAFKSKTKDAANIARMMSTKFEEVVGAATKTVSGRPQWKALLGNKSAAGTPVKPGTPVAPGGAGTLAKPVLVKELPKYADVDWTKTDDDMTMRGIRVLKNGRVIKLDR